jgi:dienelactone hydrolase
MMKEVPILIRSEGQQMVGLWHQPKGRGPQPTVLLFHGFTGNSHETHRVFVDTARALAGLGIGAIRFDFRGSGNSAGSFADMTFSSEMKDAAAALRWLRRQPGIDRSRIGLLGLSMGGLVTLRTLARDHAIKAAVVWNPAVRPDVFQFSPAQKKQLAKTGLADWGGWPVSKKFFDEYRTMNPIPVLGHVTTPLRFVVGTMDKTCNPAGSEACHEVMIKAGQDVDLINVPGADHCFCSLVWKKAAIGATVEWFQSRLV